MEHFTEAAMVLTHSRMANGMERCLQHCEIAHEVCLELADWCLRKGGAWADPETIKALEDGSDIARLAADFMIRDSQRHPAVCRACSSILEECARRLENLPEDELISRGIEPCRRCSQSCEALAGRRDEAVPS